MVYNTVKNCERGADMNLSSMEYFVVLARERNFTRAAEKLHITQQSLSAHIAALEKELGSQLVVRRVPLELTYAGQVFLRYAASFQRQLTTMRQEFCDITADQRGVLRIGIAHTRGRVIMPALIQTFQVRYPNISVELTEAPNEALCKALLNGETDLAIVHFPGSIQGVTLRDFYEEELVLLIAKDLLARIYGDGEDQTMAAVEAGDLRPLERCPFVMGNESDIAAGFGFRTFERTKIHPPIKARSFNVETLLSLCVEGVGGCFCPENLARTTLTAEQLATLRIIRLGPEAKYPIRFGYVENSYQWSIISEFMNTALNT